MHDCLRPGSATLSRRTLIVGGAGAMASATLAGPLALAAAASAVEGPPDPIPKPIPGGLDIPDVGTIHIFLPGPEGVTLPFTASPLMGLDVDPSTITDFKGFSSVAYLVGSAVGSDGKKYNFESDFRVFSGQYVAQDGSTNEGLFGLIWVDLFEPGSGSQVHDLNGGIHPSGLFWTVDFAQGSLRISPNGRRVRFKAETVPAIDTFVIFGPNDVSSAVSVEVELRARGDIMKLGKGREVPPTDPAAFRGEFFRARAEGEYSGREIGFAFETDDEVTTEGTYAEFGFERNGVFT